MEENNYLLAHIQLYEYISISHHCSELSGQTSHLLKTFALEDVCRAPEGERESQGTSGKQSFKQSTKHERIVFTLFNKASQ
jgi:hypothetical protein